jgi:hypothetical protein
MIRRDEVDKREHSPLQIFHCYHGRGADVIRLKAPKSEGAFAAARNPQPFVGDLFQLCERFGGKWRVITPEADACIFQLVDLLAQPLP